MSLYELSHDYENFLHTPIWVLPISGTHLFSGRICLSAPARLISRKPRKLQNPLKFSFPSQTKYLPPIITFVHGANPYLEFLFEISSYSFPRDFEILGCCPEGPVLPHGKKVSL